VILFVGSSEKNLTPTTVNVELHWPNIRATIKHCYY